MSIKILTDSTCNLSKEYINKYDISVVSLNVILEGTSYREIDLNNEWFYTEMAKSPSLPTSSQPSVEDMYKSFEDLIKEGHDIVGIFLSSDLSGTFSSANLVKTMILENYPNAKIELIDSRSTCMQEGFAVLEAARAAMDSKSLTEVVDAANRVISNSRFLFVPDTLDYLKKGGRIGGASALLGTLLQIKPILTVEDGKATIFTKVRTKKKAVDKIIETILEQNDKTPIKGAVVHHINCESEGVELASKLNKVLNLGKEIESISPIVGLHVGPGSIGVVYHY